MLEVQTFIYYTFIFLSWKVKQNSLFQQGLTHYDKNITSVPDLPVCLFFIYSLNFLECVFFFHVWFPQKVAVVFLLEMTCVCWYLFLFFSAVTDHRPACGWVEQKGSFVYLTSLGWQQARGQCQHWATSLVLSTSSIPPASCCRSDFLWGSLGLIKRREWIFMRLKNTALNLNIFGLYC